MHVAIINELYDGRLAFDWTNDSNRSNECSLTSSLRKKRHREGHRRGDQAQERPAREVVGIAHRCVLWRRVLKQSGQTRQS